MATANRMMTIGHIVWTVIIILTSLLVPRVFGMHNCDSLTEYWDDASGRCELCAKLCFPGQGNEKTCPELCPGFQEETSSTTSQLPVEKLTLGLIIGAPVGVSLAAVVLGFVIFLVYKKRSSIRLWFKKLRRGELSQGHLVTEEQGERNLSVPHNGVQCSADGEASRTAPAEETEAMMGPSGTTPC